MIGVIRFEVFDSFEENNDKVVEILENYGFTEDKYTTLQTSPPIYCVPGLDESDPPVDDLRELGRVSVEFEGDDD